MLITRTSGRRAARHTIFLDFDGVLNSTDDEDGDGGGWPTHGHVAQLNRIVRATNAVIVLSTGWSVHLSWDQLLGRLCVAGLRGEVIDVTPVLDAELDDEPAREDRWREIEMWLQANGYPPYVILDDIGAFGPLSARHVWTDPTEGLQDADVARAIRLLGAP